MALMPRSALEALRVHERVPGEPRHPADAALRPPQVGAVDRHLHTPVGRGPSALRPVVDLLSDGPAEPPAARNRTAASAQFLRRAVPESRAAQFLGIDPLEVGPGNPSGRATARRKSDPPPSLGRTGEVFGRHSCTRGEEGRVRRESGRSRPEPRARIEPATSRILASSLARTATFLSFRPFVPRRRWRSSPGLTSSSSSSTVRSHRTHLRGLPTRCPCRRVLPRRRSPLPGAGRTSRFASVRATWANVGHRGGLSVAIGSHRFLGGGLESERRGIVN